MRLDSRRAARTVVLLVWTGFFVYLWASGEMSRYLGPRTYWVVPFGAVVLGIATLAHLQALRSPRPSGISAAEAAGLTVLLVPILAILVVPAPSLGAQAAAKKNAAAGGVAAVGQVVPPAGQTGRDPSFIDIHYAAESEEYAAAIGVAEGRAVELTGFVTHPGNAPEGTFALTRFYVSCCAADAIPYSVFVASDDDYADDTWLRVSGVLERRDSHYVLVPDEVVGIEVPKDQYLY